MILSNPKKVEINGAIIQNSIYDIRQFPYSRNKTWGKSFSVYLASTDKMRDFDGNFVSDSKHILHLKSLNIYHEFYKGKMVLQNDQNLPTLYYELYSKENLKQLLKTGGNNSLKICLKKCIFLELSYQRI